MEAFGDREQILLAMVAVEAGRLATQALLAALDAWASRPACELFEILIEHNALTAADAAELFAACTVADSASRWHDLESNGALREALNQSGHQDVESQSASDRLHEGSCDQIGQSDRHRVEVGARHATGGLGEVLRATDRQLNREVAVKRIRALWADDAEARARFLQEAKITGRLEHPGIVPVYALGIGDDQRPYYAMRFIAGDSLEQAIERFHAQSTKIALRSTTCCNGSSTCATPWIMPIVAA